VLRLNVENKITVVELNHWDVQQTAYRNEENNTNPLVLQNPVGSVVCCVELSDVSLSVCSIVDYRFIGQLYRIKADGWIA